CPGITEIAVREFPKHAVFPAQTFQHDPDLVLGREVPTRRTPDILHYPLSRGLRRRFLQGGFGLHLRSFVTTTKPKSSLHHNLKSVPLVLTVDTRRPFRAGRAREHPRPIGTGHAEPGGLPLSGEGAGPGVRALPTDARLFLFKSIIL